MAGFVNRFLIEERGKALDELFGTSEWRDLSRRVERQREVVLLYEKSLQEIGGTKYVRSFQMSNRYNQLIYCLVFGTNHLKGLEVMKEAMWKVDPRGDYSFSDVTGHQQTYLTEYSNRTHWVPAAAGLVHIEFEGRTVELEDIREFVIADTTYIFRKKILKNLEYQDPTLIQRVTRNDGKPRRKGTFPNRCSITFSERGEYEEDEYKEIKKDRVIQVRCKKCGVLQTMILEYCGPVDVVEREMGPHVLHKLEAYLECKKCGQELNVQYDLDEYPLLIFNFLELFLADGCEIEKEPVL